MPSSFAMFARLPYMYGLPSLPTKADTGLGDKISFSVSSRRGAHPSSFCHVSLTRYLPTMPSARNLCTGTRKPAGRPTPGKHQRSPCRAPHKVTYGVLPLRLCQFQPRSSAQSQRRASTRGSIRGRLRSICRRLRRSAFATCPSDRDPPAFFSWAWLRRSSSQ